MTEPARTRTTQAIGAPGADHSAAAAETMPRSPAAASSEPPSRRILIVLIPLMLAAFIATLDQTIVATAIPGIGRGLHDLRDSSWIATSYLLTSAVSTLILGKLGDMYGRKTVFQFAIATFLVGSALCGFANSMALLIAFRALQGIGGGGLSSLVQAITGDLLPARVRARYMAYVGMITTLALIAGPLLGGLFVDQLSWRWIFFLNLPLGLVALVMVATLLHLPTRRPQRSIDISGGVTATIFIAAALVLADQGSAWGWASASTLGLLALATAGLIVYLIVERRASEPITPLYMFRSSVFSISCAQFFLATLVLFVAMLYIPQFMIDVHHYSAFESGIFLIPLLVGLIGATAVSGPAIARTGRYKYWPIIGAVLTGGGMFAISRAEAATPSWILGVVLFVVGAGVGLFVQVAVLAGQNAVVYPQLGVATGALNFFKTVGGAFGAAVFAAILTAALGGGPNSAQHTVHAFHTVFGWSVPFMALALVLAVAMREKPLSANMKEVAAGNVEVNEY